MLQGLAPDSYDPNELSPEERKRRIDLFWNMLAFDAYSGTPNGVVIEGIERDVADACSLGDIGLAESLTAQALFLLSSRTL